MASPDIVQIKAVVVDSGASVSSAFQVSRFGVLGVWIPTLSNSCEIYLQGSWDTTSANFVRLFKSDGSAKFTIATGPGSMGVTLQDISMPFQNMRFEFSVAQTALSSLMVITKL